MKRSRKYLLDADSLMTAHRQHYRFSFCPAYWKALLLHHESESVASIAQVRKELLRGKDALSEWVTDDVPETFFKETTDAKVQLTYSTITRWVVTQSHLAPAAQAKFASGADGWLVAYAAVNGYAVCTYEVSRPESKSNIKLPDVAAQFGVLCVKPPEMLEDLAVRMDLPRKVPDT